MRRGTDKLLLPPPPPRPEAQRQRQQRDARQHGGRDQIGGAWRIRHAVEHAAGELARALEQEDEQEQRHQCAIAGEQHRAEEREQHMPEAEQLQQAKHLRGGIGRITIDRNVIRPQRDELRVEHRIDANGQLHENGDAAQPQRAGVALEGGIGGRRKQRGQPRSAPPRLYYLYNTPDASPKTAPLE